MNLNGMCCASLAVHQTQISYGMCRASLAVHLTKILWGGQVYVGPRSSHFKQHTNNNDYNSDDNANNKCSKSFPASVNWFPHECRNWL